MKTTGKIVIVAAVAVVVAGVIVLKQGRSSKDTGGIVDPMAAVGATPEAGAVPPPGAKLGIPRLVDVGAGKCIPCKMMAPILEELKKEYAGRFRIDFVDVWVNPAPRRPSSVPPPP